MRRSSAPANTKSRWTSFWDYLKRFPPEIKQVSEAAEARLAEHDEVAAVKAMFLNEDSHPKAYHAPAKAKTSFQIVSVKGFCCTNQPK